MSFEDLRNLHKLHLADKAIVDIRHRAAALDPGRQIQAQLKTLETALAEQESALRALTQEQTDLELKQKGAADKVKKIEGEIYGGKVVNPREVENLEKEIAALKRGSEGHDARLLELMDEAPPVQKEVDRLKGEISKARTLLQERQKEAMAEKGKLEAAFKEASSRRAPLAKAVAPAMLVRYEAIRNKHGGIGMADAVKGNCGACGTHLATKLIEFAKDGKIVTCEACGRILYATDGLI